jgi:fido (protein-threonine AMPylation protein)
VIERLYSIDRGITHVLIERGIDESLIPHGTTDRPAAEVVIIIGDHEAAIEGIFDFVGSQRPLSTSFIKQMHQLLTRNQPTTQAIDQFGRLLTIDLLRGDWKKLPNNPACTNGTIHEYAPPEQTASEMDRLVAWHLEHQREGISPEVEAAWLHHRFTQIHPFQDGNGRVARLLATLVFLKAGWFPLSVIGDLNDESSGRAAYIHALERADEGDLKSLVDLFANAQRRAFVSSLSLAEEAINEKQSYDAVMQALVNTVQRREPKSLQQTIQEAESYADSLLRGGLTRLAGVKHDLEAALGDSSMRVTIRVDGASSPDPISGPRSTYYRSQIIEIARIFDYYANLNGYKGWVRLSIRVPELQTEILLSFHGLGRDLSGVMMCSAFGYRRLPSEEGGESHIQGLQPLCEYPFQFSYQDQLTDLQVRFGKWLESSIILALEYWRRSL